ncbi:CHAT domain-containing protein [Nonomuraea angiospora]|uniref:CHAT domain-containing tetratricopeptide repeat protein n=1 Tax=Nonomuraea angiospora TaxID=46172 RepID=UPI0034422C0F
MKAWEGPLGLLAARLEEAAEQGDPEPILTAEALAQAQHVIELLDGDETDLPAWFTLGWFFWFRFLETPQEGEMEFEAAVEMFASCFLAGADSEHLPEPLLTNIALRSSSTTVAWLRAASGYLTYEKINHALDVFRRALTVLPAQHPGRGSVLSNLAVALQTRFQHRMTSTDLDEAIDVLRSAVVATPVGHPHLPTLLANLAGVLQVRYKRTGQLGDLLDSISAAQEAVDTATGDDDVAAHRASLAAAQLAFFERTNELAWLDDAIKGFESAVAAFSLERHERAGILTNLSIACHRRFSFTGDNEDLERAVQTGHEAVRATAADHPDYAMFLANYGTALKTRFERTGSATDLDDAIEALRLAVRSTPEEHASRAIRVSALGTVLIMHAGRTGAVADFDAAIDICREAVGLTPLDHPDRAMHLNNLGIALRGQSERTATSALLDEAVAVFWQAVHATPDDHPDLGSRLTNTGLALLTRYNRAERLRDLDEAVELMERAVATVPADHTERAIVLSNLSAALLTRFSRTEALVDLARAQEAAQEAADTVPPGHLYEARYRSNLSGILKAQYDLTGSTANLDAAVQAAQAAVTATKAEDPYKARYLSTAGAILAIRHSHTGVAEDLGRAVEVGREAVETAPLDHPERVTYLLNLGQTLRSRFDVSGDQSDIDGARSIFESAATLSSARPTERILAARAAVELMAATDPGRAADLLETAVRLLPEVASRRLGRGDQQYALGELAGLTGDAAAFALSDPGGDDDARAWRAIRLLEAGRAVLLNRALDTRSDVSELRAMHPRLAARFEELRDLLDQDPDLLPTQDSVPDRRHLEEELAATFERIRTVEGFASFGLPPMNEQLLVEAEAGPIICFNVTAYRSDALILSSRGVASLALPDLTENTLVGKIDDFYHALAVATRVESGLLERRDAQSRLHDVLRWLWDAAVGPVLAVLNETDARAWWVTGGLLGFLPVHAAGHHTEIPEPGYSRRTIMDRVLFSYTPTIRSLAHARRLRDRVSPSGKSLIVAMPTTPDIPGELHHVLAESGALRTRLPEPLLLVEVEGAASAYLPTKANVLDHMNDCTIAHFACHGVADLADPSKSRLLLHDHADDPLTVASLMGISLDWAGLAYLSACRTAFSGSVELRDEAIHLASAFQLAGFPYVVGTLWEVDDAISAQVAEGFYDNLRTASGDLDLARSCSALHEIIRDVRDRFPSAPSLWAAYLHAGA